MSVTSDLKSIILAIELATRQRDELVKAVGKAERNVRFAKDQMAQLEGYVADTDNRWLGATSGARTSELVRHHYQFMDRLQQAVGLQSGVIGNTLRQLESANKALLQAEFRLSGLNTILKARQDVLLRAQRRREQREVDEFAAQKYIRTHTSPITGEQHGY